MYNAGKTMLDLGCLRSGGKKINKKGTICRFNAYMLKEFQSLVKSKIILFY